MTLTTLEAISPNRGSVTYFTKNERMGSSEVSSRLDRATLSASRKTSS